MVSVLSRELQYRMMVFKNREIVNVDRNTHFFTQHEWHMNAFGKGAIVRT
jgi:hypothetical protein